MTLEEQEIRAARRQARKLKHFYSHLITYGVVIAFLHIINLLTTSHYWAFWPAFGWGIGVAMHGISTFHFHRFFGPEWEERQVQKIMARNREHSADL